MTSLYNYLVRGDDGVWSTAYGPFVLRSALQPIFRQPQPGIFDIAAFQGLVRAEKNGEPYPPSQFFPLVNASDLPLIDNLLRAIHILNFGLEDRENTFVFINLNPDLYSEPGSLRHALEHIRLIAHEANIALDRIVCEIPLATTREVSRALALARQLRETEFRLAVSDYGAGDGDLERVHLFKPDFARFDNVWVKEFMHNPAGLALLKVIVRQFVEEGCEPLFDRLEEELQVEICTEIGVPLLQGYALAQPRLMPTGFRADFPPMLPPVAAAPRPHQPGVDITLARPLAAAAEPRAARPRPTFGKRQA